MTDFLKKVPSIDDPVEMASKVFDPRTEESYGPEGRRIDTRHLFVLDAHLPVDRVVCQCDATARSVDGCLRDMSEFTPDNFDEAVLAAGREQCARGRKGELMKTVSKAMPTRPVIAVDLQDEEAVQAFFRVLDTPLDAYNDFPPAVLPDIQGGIESWTWAAVFVQVPDAREKLFGRAWPSLKGAAKKVGLDATLDIPADLLSAYLARGKKE